MRTIAIKILTGSTGRFAAIVMGVTFAALLIAQQASIFCGLIRMTSNQARDITDAAIWVMDPSVQFIDDVKPMSASMVQRVRGVSGVQWAVPMSKSIVRARLPDGRYQQAILIGLDDASYVGGPADFNILSGSLDALGEPDSVMVDKRGAAQIWPDEPNPIGLEFEMNDSRAKVVGVFNASRTFQTFPVIITRFSRSLNYQVPDRKTVSFILAGVAPETDAEGCCTAIEKSTGLMAKTRDQFIWMTINYYLTRTGIPINFGITVILGFLVGLAISGQTFYLFTVENLRYYATFKAIGATDGQVAVMVVRQAVLVGCLGLALGLGLATAFGIFADSTAKLAFYMPWQVVAITCASVMLMILMASLLSLRKLVSLDPAELFRSEG
jgi:putative ABC transport system permease protein